MKLYYAPGACSLSPHIVALEAGVPLELMKVDTKTHRIEGGRDFYEVNSRGYVPVLELDDGAMLREGSAIVQFLADGAPQAHLVPAAGTMDRVRAQEWLNFIATEYHKQFIWLLRGGPEEVLRAQREKIGRVLFELEQHLRSREYMMGDRFTVVDAYAFTITRWCNVEKVKFDLEPHGSVRAFLARIAERPAVQAALRAEGLVPS
jgi:glutathione S-transferase